MKLYKPNKAAKLIVNVTTGQPGVSPQRVIQLCEQGRIGQRVGAGWVISQKEIDKFNQLDRPKGRPKKD